MSSSQTRNIRLTEHLSHNLSPVYSKDICNMCLQEQSMKHLKKSSGPSINTDEKKKEKNNNTDNCKAFCITPKRNKKKTKRKAIQKFYALYKSQQKVVKT